MDLVRHCLGNFVLEFKIFLERFEAKARHSVCALRIRRKAFVQTYWTRSKTFSKNGFEARVFSEKYERFSNILDSKQGVFMFKHFLDLKQAKNAELLI